MKKHFKSMDSLENVINVLNEAAEALHNKRRTIKESAIPEILTSALEAEKRGVSSFAAIYGVDASGLSDEGMMSKLKKVSRVVINRPIPRPFPGPFPEPFSCETLLAGIVVRTYLDDRKLTKEKYRLYVETLKILQRLQRELEDINEEDRERRDYIKSLLILLKYLTKELEEDTGFEKGL